MNPDVKAQRLSEIAERALPAESFDCWPVLQQRLAERRGPLSLRLSPWRLAMAITVLLAVAGASIAITSSPPPVSAESLLDRAGAASLGATPSGIHSYHVLATTTLQLEGGRPAQISTEETWSDGAGHIRQETRQSDWTSLTVVTTDGRTWWQVTREGQIYAAPAPGIRFSETAQLNPLATEGASIESLLAEVRQRGCGEAALRPDQTVAGREAYQVAITRRLRDGCDSLASLAAPVAGASPASATPPLGHQQEKQPAAGQQPVLAKQPGGPVAQPSPSPAPPGPEKQAKHAELEAFLNQPVVDTLWIDKQSFLPLKAIRNLGPKGTSVYEVARLDLNTPIAPDTFSYTPPATAQTFASPMEMKLRLAAP